MQQQIYELQNIVEKTSNYKYKYIVDNSIQDAINISIIDPVITQTKPIILNNNCNQPTYFICIYLRKLLCNTYF